MNKDNPTTWAIGKARDHFSEIIEKAQKSPQIIEDRKANGARSVAVISLSDLKELEAFRRERKKSEHAKKIEKLALFFNRLDKVAATYGLKPDEEILLPRGTHKNVIDFAGGEE